MLYLIWKPHFFTLRLNRQFVLLSRSSSKQTKYANNIIMVWKLYYINILKNEFDTTSTYTPAQLTKDSLLFEHIQALGLAHVLLVEINPFPNLSLFFRTLIFEYPSVLSRFCLLLNSVLKLRDVIYLHSIGFLSCTKVLTNPVSY